ncbi:MAG: hypothetical protein HOH43_23520 [Candidatus Latescibacteria bacterium]|nr:hypothetical protein [Candidatus Latescibacterota bacterium]
MSETENEYSAAQVFVQEQDDDSPISDTVNDLLISVTGGLVYLILVCMDRSSVAVYSQRDHLVSSRYFSVRDVLPFPILTGVLFGDMCQSSARNFHSTR